ncbi:transposase [Verticillium dahliae]
MESASKESRLILAVQAIKQDPNLSARAAAKIYNVDDSTLARRRRGQSSRRDITPLTRILTDLEESTIVQYVLDLDSRSFPPRLSGVEDMANRLLAERDATKVGKNWASNFRAQCEDPDVIRGWFDLVRNTIAKYGIVESDIYNFDETGFMMGVISTGMVVTSVEDVPPRNYTLPQDWAIGTTENGWTTNEKGLEWIRHFDKHTKPRTAGGYRLLVLDGHASHHSTDFELFCKENRIITLCMPPHSSHLLQPLDVGCFGPLKKSYGRQIEDLMRASTTHITKEDFLPAFFAAFQASMTEKNVQGGFRGAGIVPFDPESVISRLDVKPRTPTPEEGVPEALAPWVSKTPNNPTEASSQSNFIKCRIAHHQNSSPTSIFEAVDHLAKGSRGIMHKMALMQSEIMILRAANETLSRRRRAKKTRLRQGGSLTLAEGQDIQTQRDVEVQIKEETRRSSGQQQRTKPKERRCGTCGQPGHNARTCQIEATVHPNAMETPSKESQLILALQAMERNPELSMRRAADIFNVPKTTLRRRRNGTPSRRDSPPNSANLNEGEEQAVIRYILDMDSRADPPRPKDVAAMANTLLDERGARRVGINWATSFVKRRPELQTRFFRPYDYRRALCGDPVATNAWFRDVRDTIAKYGVADTDIYNFDETGFQMGVINSGIVVTSSEKRSSVKKKQPGNREWVTVIQGVGANGFCVPPFVVFSGKYHLSSWYEDDVIPRDWKVAIPKRLDNK